MVDNMNSYSCIKYYIHSGSVRPVPRYADASGLASVLNNARRTAYQDMVGKGVQHAIYGVKYYGPEGINITKVDIFIPSILLSESDFTDCTNMQMREHPGCCILAVHSRT